MDKGLSLREIHDFFTKAGFPKFLQKFDVRFNDITNVRIIDLRTSKAVFICSPIRETLIPELRFELSRMTDTTKNFQVVIETETREFRL